MQNNQIDPGLASYAEDWEKAMKRAFKGSGVTAKQRRQNMIDGLRRRTREQENADA
jgi:hypothetical protein